MANTNMDRERCKKTRKKKLTSVSFAFTHAYTPVKTKNFPFFPKRTWKILKNVQKLKQNIARGTTDPGY